MCSSPTFPCKLAGQAEIYRFSRYIKFRSISMNPKVLFMGIVIHSVSPLNSHLFTNPRQWTVDDVSESCVSIFWDMWFEPCEHADGDTNDSNDSNDDDVEKNVSHAVGRGDCCLSWVTRHEEDCCCGEWVTTHCPWLESLLGNDKRASNASLLRPTVGCGCLSSGSVSCHCLPRLHCSEETIA